MGVPSNVIERLSHTIVQIKMAYFRFEIRTFSLLPFISNAETSDN